MQDPFWSIRCLLCDGFHARDYLPVHDHLKNAHSYTSNDIFHTSCRAVQSNRHYIYTLPDGRDCMEAQLTTEPEPVYGAQ